MSIFGGLISVTSVSFLMLCVATIAVLGYALGRITIKGISLGTSGVFVVALLFGCFLYKSLEAQLGITTEAKEVVVYADKALKIIETIGLAFFVTAVGFIAGPKFFGNFKRNFKSYVLMAVVIILAGGLTAVGCVFLGRKLITDVSAKELTAMVSGLLSGALTSTPAFSAAKEAVGADLEGIVSVGYGIAYIFGVLGVVFFVQLMPKILKADMDKERALAGEVGDYEKKEYAGKIIKLDDFSYLAFFFAVALGIVIGAIKIPLSGKGFEGTCFSLTTTGGCLLVALVLGHFGHIGSINVIPSERTLKALRELGLMLFLMGAGIPGGAKFVQYFKGWYFLFGVFMTVIPMIIGYLFAKFVLKLPLLNNLGSITGGMTSTPALGTLIHVARSEDVASAYAATYPVALIAVVLVTQFLILLF